MTETSTTVAQAPEDVGDNRLLYTFIWDIRHTVGSRVLELGTRRWNPEVRTAHHDWAGDDTTWVGTDFIDGLDVDIVADVQTMSSIVGENAFDFVVSCSTFEHIARPWRATAEIAKVLKPGGQVFIATCHTFPTHGFPDDYWRFSTSALEMLCTDVGLEIVGSDYQFPCKITYPDWDQDFGGFLESRVVARKPGGVLPRHVPAEPVTTAVRHGRVVAV